jgi:capsular polysaccharide biosynthesis protein
MAAELISRSAHTASNSAKIFISDNAPVNWNNTKEDENLLESKGCLTVSLKNRSFQQIINLFSDAQLIISYNADILTNLIYCQSNSQLLVISPLKTNQVENIKLAKLAQFIGVKLHYFMANTEPYITQDSSYSSKACITTLNSLLDKISQNLAITPCLSLEPH